MLKQVIQQKEKKVEYIELIYDLIFVYIIGRNNSLLHSFENGFVSLPAFSAYILTTLAVIQIWNYTTYYINIYGRHSIREHVFLFVNMFLLYFIGEGTRADWQNYHTQYNITWALILINIGVQYLFELRKQSEGGERRRQTMGMAVVLFTQAAVVALDIPVYQAVGASWLSFAGILFGMAAVMIMGRRSSRSYVDFNHLSERAMLYVVFTFGEMIIAISSYFEGGFDLRSLYFALMAFLIVVGLFVSYGVFYDRIIDREKPTNGLGYMLLHIFIIFAMNNITNSLEFMREDEVSLMPKIIFLICSFIMYFAFLFALGARYGNARCQKYSDMCLRSAAITVCFASLMVVLRENMAANIAVSVVFVFSQFGHLFFYSRNMNKAIE